MSAFTKELRRREKLKQQQQQDDSEEEIDHFVEQQPKKMNVFALLNDEDEDNSNFDDDDDNEEEEEDAPSKKVSIENLKPSSSKRAQKKNQKKILKQLEELDLGNDDNDQDDDEDGEAMTTSALSNSNKKKKSKKNKKANNKKKQKSSGASPIDNEVNVNQTNEDDEFLEKEFQKAIAQQQDGGREATAVQGVGSSMNYHPDLDLFKVDFSYLNPDYEFKKLFGGRAFSAANQQSTSDQNQYLPDVIRNNRHHSKMRSLNNSSAFSKSHALQLVTSKPHWPHYVPLGLTCTLDKVIGGVNGTQLELYVIDDSLNDTYKILQRSYAQAISSHDPESLMAILQREHPYHIHTLLQLAEVFRTMYHEADQAQDLIEKALLALQHALNSNAFIRSLKEGRARLPYNHDLNRVFYHVVLTRLHTLSRSGGHATAFELCKLLFSLSHIDSVSYDPAHILLFLDYYALRAGKYDWMVNQVLPYFDRISDPEAGRMPPSLLPNFMFAKAFCYYFMNDMFKANEALQSALIMWPMTLGVIVNETAGDQIPTWERITRNSIFTDHVCPSPLLSRLMHIAVQRHVFFWKQDPQMLRWLKQNVESIVNQGGIGSNEFNVKQKEALKLRKKVYDDVAIATSYENVYEQEVMGNILPMQEEDALSTLNGQSQQQNPVIAFLSSLLPWTNTGQNTPQ